MRLLYIVSMVAALASAPATAAAQAKKARPAQGHEEHERAEARERKDKAAAGRKIEITAGDDMKYSVTSIIAKPGETLHIVLENVGVVPKVAMAHNLIVLNAGVDGKEFSLEAMLARDTEYVPAARKADIVASTGLAGPGETVEVTFKAPAKVGAYPFVCTFPTHFSAGMKGELTVK